MKDVLLWSTPDAAGGTVDGIVADVRAKMARQEHNPRSRSLRRALLTPQVNPESLYRCGKRTFKRAACGLEVYGKGADVRPKRCTLAGLWRLELLNVWVRHCAGFQLGC